MGQLKTKANQTKERCPRGYRFTEKTTRRGLVWGGKTSDQDLLGRGNGLLSGLPSLRREKKGGANYSLKT